MGTAVLKDSARAAPLQGSALPPLTNGDHLTWKQFAARWDATPGLKKAELINGVVYMSPLLHPSGRFENILSHWVGHYGAYTDGTESGSNTTARMLGDAPQPDAYLRILENCGGQSWVAEKYLHGAPELVAEACYTSAAYDLNEKLELYQRAGVQEYVTVLISENEIRWHRLEKKRFVRVALPKDGVYRSKVIPGLWLNTHAMLRQNMKTVLSTLNRGLKSAEHAAFVEKLKAQRS